MAKDEGKERQRLQGGPPFVCEVVCLLRADGQRAWKQQEAKC